MPKKSTKSLTREQWLKERHGKIGSSSIGAIMGINDYQSPYDVYTELTSEEPIQRVETPKMRRGIEMEPLLHELFQKRHPELKVRNDNVIRSHPQFPHFIANLDRTIVDRQDGRGPGILELKTADSFSMKAWKDGIPLQYFAQVQWQLFVTGYLWAKLYVKVTDTWEDLEFDIERDEEYIAMMVEIASQFHEAVQNKDIDAIPLTAVDLDKIPETPGLSVTATDAIRSLCELAANLSLQIKDLESQEKDVKGQLKTFCDKAESIVDDKGVVLATYRMVVRKGYTVPDKSYRSLQVKNRKENDGR